MDNLSVIIRNRNEERYIGYAIQSVLDNFDKPEIIVVDNNSIDGSMGIVNTFDFSVKSETNQWSITGSTGNDYTVKLNNSDTYECDCIGYKRAKDGKCKHIKQVIAENC